MGDRHTPVPPDCVAASDGPDYWWSRNEPSAEVMQQMACL